MWCSVELKFGSPLSSVINNHHLSYHLYADDTQIYISMSTPDENCSLQQLRNCLDDNYHWMNDSKLK